MPDDIAGKGASLCITSAYFFERLEELVIIISNSEWRKQYREREFPAYENPKLVATNIGCWRWTGSTTSTEQVTGQVTGGTTITTTQDVVFERYRFPELPDGTLSKEGYAVIGGTGNWRFSGYISDCQGQGSGSLPLIAAETKGWIGLEIENYVTSGVAHRAYYGNVVADPNVPGAGIITYSCRDGRNIDTPYNMGSWWSTNLQPFKVSEDGKTIDGTLTLTGIAGSTKYQWHFEAQRES